MEVESKSGCLAMLGSKDSACLICFPATQQSVANRDRIRIIRWTNDECGSRLHLRNPDAPAGYAGTIHVDDYPLPSSTRDRKRKTSVQRKETNERASDGCMEFKREGRSNKEEKKKKIVRWEKLE